MNYKHRKCKLWQIGLIKKSSISKDLKTVFFYFQRHSLGRCRKEAWKMLMELSLVHVWQLQEPQSKTQGPTSVPPLTPMALIWDCRNSLLKQLLIVTKALVLRWFKASFFFFSETFIPCRRSPANFGATLLSVFTSCSNSVILIIDPED